VNDQPLQLAAGAGDRIEVTCRINRRARRVGLRIDNATGKAVLVLPSRRALDEGLRFAEAQIEWLRSRLAAVGEPRPFRAGSSFPLEGRTVRIVRGPVTQRNVLLYGSLLFVPPNGDLAARLRRWLRQRSLQRLEARVARHAAVCGVRVGRIGVRDPRTRWGSCTREGDLSFSWRLVLAPPAVLDYVAAHEVAHRRHLNHGPAFWALVERLRPDYETQRDWLRLEGPSLHRYV
jgi:predicted metal-dependent hydrolase